MAPSSSGPTSTRFAAALQVRKTSLWPMLKINTKKKTEASRAKPAPMFSKIPQGSHNFHPWKILATQFPQPHKAILHTAGGSLECAKPKPEKSKLRNPIFPKKFYVGPKKNLEAQFRRFGLRISDPENAKPIRVNLNQPQPTPRFVNRKKIQWVAPLY